MNKQTAPSEQAPTQPQVQTSAKSPAIAERIRQSSEKFIKRNYDLYKALENK